MAYANSYNSLHCNEEFDFDDENLDDFYPDQTNTNNYENNHNNNHHDESGGGEDTDEASENEYIVPASRNVEEPIEIREQMYQDKLANLKKQLEELKNGVHPEYIRRVKKLDAQYKERLRLNDIYKDYLIECVERDYANEKKAAGKEYEEKKADLKENLLTDFEDKRKMIESERHSMELTGDSMEVKPTVTRKLRRRPNEPLPVASEKRRKPPTGQLVLLLDEKDIDNDLKLMSRGAPGINSGNGMATNSAQMVPNNDNYPIVETKIEDGKLLYERRWFHRGQPVFVEGRDMSKYAATISAIGTEVIWVKRLTDGNRIKIYTSQLSRGKVSIKRRAN